MPAVLEDNIPGFKPDQPLGLEASIGSNLAARLAGVLKVKNYLLYFLIIIAPKRAIKLSINMNKTADSILNKAPPLWTYYISRKIKYCRTANTKQ